MLYQVVLQFLFTYSFISNHKYKKIAGDKGRRASTINTADVSNCIVLYVCTLLHTAAALDASYWILGPQHDIRENRAHTVQRAGAVHSRWKYFLPAHLLLIPVRLVLVSVIAALQKLITALHPEMLFHRF